MAFSIREMSKEDIGMISDVNRRETAALEYEAQPTEDGWGIALKHVTFVPPEEVERWDAEEVEERIGSWLPERSP